MERRPDYTLAIRLVMVLVLLTVVFAAAVYLTELDSERTKAKIQAALDEENRARQEELADWHQVVVRQHARQLAAPFLWNVSTLEGFQEGSREFERLQRRMWQFVYGKDRRPEWEDAPVGPLESVLVIDLDYRIVAASDPMVVDKRFNDPDEIARLEAARLAPQVRRLDEQRADGLPVREVTVAVPNDEGETIGLVRMRYVGGDIARLPLLPRVQVDTETQLWGPVLAGFLALLGVGFGALATAQVIGLTRRLEAMAGGQKVTLGRSAGDRALSLIEEKLETLSSAVRRDDLLLESLTEALREGVVVIDARGGSVVANNLARDVLQLPDSEDAASAAQDFDSLLDGNPALAAIVDLGLQGGEAVREKSLTLRVGHGQEDLPVQVTSYVFQDAGQPSGLMLLFKDRASIRTLERNLREASRLQAIARLTGSVAHEVRNPLGAIGIHLEQLRRRVSKMQDQDPQAEERIGVIREEIARLDEILREWLHLTAPEERAAAEASVNDVLSSVGRLLRVEARHQGVELVVDLPGESPLVTLNVARLRQVLLNLSLNALQAMPDGGRLTLAARQEGSFVMLEVDDTGPGIPRELRERIFELNFTTRENGSGLGLAICKRLVEEAGGHITLAAHQDHGTTFRVVLPVAAMARGVGDERVETRHLGA